MNIKRYETFEELLIYKNVQLIQTAVHLFIITKKLYGSAENYENPYFVESITPVIKEYKIVLFRGNKEDISLDLLLTVNTSVGVNKVATFNGQFTITASCDLNEGIKNFKILSIQIGDKLRLYSKKNSLTEKLIPYIYKENYEIEAETFLSKYYPEALVDPIPIPIDEIIQNMGLRKINAILDSNVKGMITFRKEKIYKTDYFSEGSLINETEINKGTIVINENLVYEHGAEAKSITLIHECLHWHLHKAYMELQIILKNVKPTLINYDEEIKNENNKELMYIENQARVLTPLVLMPKVPSISKFEQLVFKYRDIVGLKNPAIIYKAALTEFAEYFNVPYEYAKTRMYSLGYSENLYNEPVLYESNKKEVRFISRWDYERLISADRVFMNLVERHIIKYIDGFVVINLKPYVEETEYGPKISNFGLKNIRDCTLKFEIKRNRDIGFRSSDPKTYALLYHELSATSTQITINKEQLHLIIKRFEDTQDNVAKKKFFRDFRFEELNFSYNDYLHILMQRHNKSVNQLVISSNLSESVIKKYRAGRGVTYTIETTLAICAGLKAYPYETLNLLTLMGFDYENIRRKGTKLLPKHDHYYHLIINEYDSGIDKWNEYLIKNKEKPLSLK